MRRLAAVLVLSPLLLSPAIGAQSPSQPGTPDASWARLIGRVVDSVTGQPVVDVPVLLQCSWLDGRWGRLEGTTDANGQFTIATPAGQCTLALNVARGFGAEGPGLRLYEFAPGETVETVRRLERYPVARPLEGRLLDDRGEPVSGVRVIIRSDTLRAGTRQWTARSPVQTDAAGAFRLPFVGPGSWEVVVPALGLTRLVEVPRSASAPPSPEPIVIRGARVATFQVSGRVETPPGTARRFGAIYLDRGDSPSTNPLTIAETAVADSGTFAFPNVPAGSYRIRIDTSPTMPGGLRNAPTEIWWGITPVVVTGDVNGVRVIARPGPKLRAEVRLDDQALAPNQGVLLGIDAAGGRFVPLVQTVDGYLIAPGLFPERYRIRFTGIPTGYRIKSVTAGGRDVTQEGVDLRDGPIDDMIITLTKQLTEVKGVVRDAQDRPDGEAAVLAFPTNRRLWTETGQAPAFIGNAHVSQKGNYSVKGLPPGEYFVVATISDPLLAMDTETLGRLAPLAERIRLAEGQTMALNLRSRN
jgi:hypothetical protein